MPNDGRSDITRKVPWMPSKTYAASLAAARNDKTQHSTARQSSLISISLRSLADSLPLGEQHRKESILIWAEDGRAFLNALVTHTFPCIPDIIVVRKGMMDIIKVLRPPQRPPSSSTIHLRRRSACGLEQTSSRVVGCWLHMSTSSIAPFGGRLLNQSPNCLLYNRIPVLLLSYGRSGNVSWFCRIRRVRADRLRTCQHRSI